MHFPHLCPEENAPPITPEQATVPSQPEHAPISSYNALWAVAQELALSLQTLGSATKTMDPLADYLAMVDAACSANYSLLAVNASIQGTCALPEKDVIAPNQKTWPETAVWMGIKPPRMWKCLPKEHGVTAKSIGIAKSKKWKHTEPYGKQAKRAKSDAMSAKANEHARGHALSPASNAAVFPLTPLSASALPTPAFPSAPPTFNFGLTFSVPLFPLTPAFLGALIFHFRSTSMGSVPPHVNVLHVMKMWFFCSYINLYIFLL
jgi:hypothetical protein